MPEQKYNVADCVKEGQATRYEGDSLVECKRAGPCADKQPFGFTSVFCKQPLREQISKTDPKK